MISIVSISISSIALLISIITFFVNKAKLICNSYKLNITDLTKNFKIY
jgi:hypothetical protein